VAQFHALPPVAPTVPRTSRRNHYWWIASLVFVPYVALLLPYTWRTIQRRGPRIGLMAWAGFALIVGATANQPSQVAVVPTVTTVTTTSSNPPAAALLTAPPASSTIAAVTTHAATTKAVATAALVAASTSHASASRASVRSSHPAGGDIGNCGGDSYVNSDGNCIERPTHAAQAPAGATAMCRDGTYSFSAHRSGTCSHHGGVAEWL